MALKVTVEVEAVNAVTPLQLPPILITELPEQVMVPTVILPVTANVPVPIVMVPLLVAAPFTLSVWVPIARVPEVVSAVAVVVPCSVPPLFKVSVA